jgi:hypothetical protein
MTAHQNDRRSVTCGGLLFMSPSVILQTKAYISLDAYTFGVRYCTEVWSKQ